MVLVGLKITLAFQKKNALTEGFVSVRSTNKIGLIQKRALRQLYIDYTSTFDSLLARPNKPSMILKLYQTLRWRFLKH